MHPLYAQADALTSVAIGAALEVHSDKGPGLIESIYERCLVHELRLCGVSSVNQKTIRITYKDLTFEDALRFDLLLNGCLLLELKSVEAVLPVHKAQLLSYMKPLNVPVGLLINFNVSSLKTGISRLYLPGANKP